jgi:hypothetical protein
MIAEQAKHCAGQSRWPEEDEGKRAGREGSSERVINKYQSKSGFSSKFQTDRPQRALSD